ncbi:MAG: cell division protein FtsQ/DivIB [Proteobacteria bacterium]|nr:cell division protein FtsQ/DivIB [Pseudomonadota bacterium]
MIRAIFSSAGFFWSVTLFAGLLVIFIVSFDQRKIDRVVVVGELSETQLMNVKQVLDDMNATASDVETIRGKVSSLEWVYHANVRKKWPNAVSVEVVPEQVIAYWNDNGFINSDGNVLVTNYLVAGDLPHLYGPAGAELEVMQRFQQMSLLLASQNHEIQALTLSGRGDWRIETRGKVEVLLGKEDLRARLDRFLEVSRRLEDSGNAAGIERMDARYVNGVAVHFSDNNQLELADINKSAGERSL